MEIVELVDAKKEKIDSTTAWNLLKNGKIIKSARGKKVVSFDPKKDSQGEILKNAMGPSGNLRAPTLKINGQILVGFNEELYREYFG